MTQTLASGVVSPALVVPVCAALMIAVAVHAATLDRTKAPRSRRAIRLLNAWVMLLALPLIAAGFSLIDPDIRPRQFVLVWFAAGLLITCAVFLAAIDMLNTWRLERRAQTDLHARLAALPRRAPDAD